MNILLVEDNDDDRVLVETMLNDSATSPYRFEFADRTSDAISRLADDTKEVVDVVLLDLTLPGSSGLDTFHQVAAQAPHFPIIVMSGMNDEELAVKAVRYGAQDYLVKGKVSSELLKRSVEYAVERKRIQEKVQESERTLSMLMSNLPGMVYRSKFDADLTFEFTSNGCLDLVEIPSIQLLERRITHKQIVHAQDWVTVQDVIKREISEQRPYQLTYRIQTQSGQEKWVWEKGAPVLNAKGELVAVEGFITDVTPRHRAEQYKMLQVTISLILAEAKELEEVAPRILEAVCLTLDWEFGALWSPEPKTAQLACRSLWQVKTLNNEAFIDATRSRRFESGIGLPGRIWKNKEPVWIPDIANDKNFPRLHEANTCKFHGAFGVPILIHGEVLSVLEFLSSRVQEPDQDLIALMTIVSSQIGQFIETKQLEEQLRLSQKLEAVGQLAGGVAHDFNNLLTAINGYCSLLLLDAEEGHPMRHGLNQIQYAGERAAGLTRQLLAFGRKQVLEPKVLNLNESVEAIESLIKRLIGENIQWTPDLGADISNIKADPGQIEQILMNLCVNARDAMPDGGALTIETRNIEVDDLFARAHGPITPGSYVRLTISDNGCGMTKETQARIFEPFYTTKEKGKGTGLGMATVYGIVKQSGGYIWLYSEVGIGTNVQIYFKPEIGSALISDTDAVVESDSHGTETILLVEDEDVVRDLACAVLQSWGYTVIQGRDGHDGLRVCARYQQQIDMLLTDTVMPGMHGPEMAEKIVELRPGIKVLYMSGYTDHTIVQHGILKEGTAFLRKPFQAKVLAKKVREVLDRS